MKKTIALLFVAAGLLSVQAARATPYDTTVTPARVKESQSKPKRAVYYVTSVSATGSHLPVVVCRYKGQYHGQSALAVYGNQDFDRTGQLSVSGELAQRDPAISSAGRR